MASSPNTFQTDTRLTLSHLYSPLHFPPLILPYIYDLTYPKAARGTLRARWHRGENPLRGFSPAAAIFQTEGEHFLPLGIYIIIDYSLFRLHF